MRIERLQYFIDLYEMRNYTKVAQKNFISQTSVTQFIQSLENEFGVHLFDRNTQPISPTAAGDRFYQEASILLRLYEKLKTEMENFNNSSIAPVRLYYTSQIDIQLLIPFLNTFRKKYPSVKIDIAKVSFTRAIAALSIGECDAVLGVHFPPIDDPKIHTTTLYKGSYHAVVGTSHPLYGRESVAAAELYSYPFIMLSPQMIGAAYQAMLENCQKDGYRPIIQKTVDDLETEFYCIATENLIGFVPENYQLGPYSGTLCKLPILGTCHEFGYTLAYTPQKSPAVSILVEEMQRYLKVQ